MLKPPSTAPYLHTDLTKRIIGAAIEVHKSLGPGFLESIYEEALCVELRRLGIPFAQQCPIGIFHRGVPVGSYRLDLLVDDKIIVEIKAVVSIEPIHLHVTMAYLKATSLNIALVLNYRCTTLQCRRLFRPFDPSLPRSFQ